MGLLGPLANRSSPRRPALSADLARWVAAGLLSEEQSAAILAHERLAMPTAAPAPRPATGPRRVPVAAEALGYLGGVLAVIGLVLVVARYWPDMAVLGRLGLSGAGALALFGGGALVREEADPALARLRGFLWLASTATTALFAGVLTADTFDAGSTETVVLACAGAAALHSGLLWRNRERPLQQLAFLGGLAAFAGALVAEFAPTGAVGLAVWAVGAAFVFLGLARRTPLPVLTEGSGAAAAIVGAAITVSASPAFGLPFVVATGFGLLAVATVPRLAGARADQLTVGILGGLALLQGVPSTLGYFSPDAGGVTGLTTWLLGGALVLVGARRLVRFPIVAEVLGGVAIIGGAALTGVQWHGFAPIFGLATAVGLVALGMVPGRALMSLFGSLGLLVNVPWAIAWFFPGEGRVPLLILVSGALILVIAVLLARKGDRFRRDLGGRQRRGPRSGIVSSATH